ncbi:MAG: hypothetical protein KAX80_11895, partial [Planctomycetes bacterium]|nr:hypothetical protein [Planctomycetota bacterium]
VDYLWVKALHLQLEGKWIEVRALAELIARLQPHFPTVWVFNSWNLAYNISVEWADPADQWAWVKEGLAYLDEGRKRNPESLQIFFQKGWTYWHKIVFGPSVSNKDYFRERLMEEEGKNPYEAALPWFRLAQLQARQNDERPERQHPFIAKSQVEAMVYHTLDAWAEELMAVGNILEAEKKWIEVRNELEGLRERNGEKFYYFDGFDRDYRDVLQVLAQIEYYRETAPELFEVTDEQEQEEGAPGE